MTVVIAEIIGWIATVFRSAGMLCKSADWVKYLVSIGNLCWMVNGIMTNNMPLIASNAICLLIMVVDVVKARKVKKPEVLTVEKDKVLAAYEATFPEDLDRSISSMMIDATLRWLFGDEIFKKKE